jgi:hypothetical protein
MKDDDEKISHRELKHRLRYNPKTGVFVWRNPKGVKKKRGDRAGSLHRQTGYLIIGVNYVRYYAHILAWFYVNGEWPQHEIDHRDGDPCNNAISNLRDVPHKKNIRNSKKWSHNTSGTTGVRFDKRWKKWVAYIGHKRLGLFEIKEDAVKARLAAEKKLRYSPRHGK